MTPQERLKNYPLHESQRGYFGMELYKQMAEDPSIWLVTGDLGYKMFDAHFEDFPDRTISVGAAEAAMLGIAVGLALEGKKPFVYTITSFFLRAAETISLYLDGEQIGVRLAGGGRDDDYSHDGPSHNGTKAQEFIKSMNIQQFYPEDKDEIPEMVKTMINSDKPSFISLRR